MQPFRHRRSRAVVVIALCLAVAVVGSAYAGSTRTDADSEIAVTLGKPQEFSLKASAASAKAGEVALTVRNQGKITHEFILLRTAIKAAKLKPRAGEPEKVVEPGFVLELEDVEPKDRVTVVMPMKKGHYVLLCNVAGHHAGGMFADLTLR